VLAVASSMLSAAYFMLRDGVEYHDLGSQYFDPTRQGTTLQAPPSASSRPRC